MHLEFVMVTNTTGKHVHLSLMCMGAWENDIVNVNVFSQFSRPTHSFILIN